MTGLKRCWNDPAVIFTALRVCCALAVLAMIALSRPGLRGAWPEALLTLAEDALWAAAWASFFRLCGRLKRETAFTEKNAAALRFIALLCAGMGALLTVEELAVLQTRNLSVFLLDMLAGPVIFFGVTVVLLVLGRLLRRAISLQRDSDATI